MIDLQNLKGRRARVLNRIHARVVTFNRSSATFVTPPEPRTVGSYARGRQLLAGNFHFAGHLVAAPERTPWEIKAPDAGFARELHGFGWLDDMAAVGDREARETSAFWLRCWIERFGGGRGPGWDPDLTGRRLIRWINHADFLLRGQPDDYSVKFHRLLAQQTRFLGRRWHTAGSGLPRLEALTGLICAGMTLDGLGDLAEPAVPALVAECATRIDAAGGVPSRNPEELLEIFTLLTWAAAALSEADKPVPQPHLDAIERIAPCLRTLRHSDGGLARFHGGGRGVEGRLDHALAASGIKNRMPDGLSMGYARLSAGRTSVIIDAGVPPKGKASRNAHASTLAFELTSGRRPMIVNCGSGAGFGPDWHRAGRATPSHSTLCLDGHSSARLGDVGPDSASEELVAAPAQVPIDIGQGPEGRSFQGGHDGYVATHGLTHARTLEISQDGRGMAGEDMLVALDETGERRFDEVMRRTKRAGVPFDISFHLHPDVHAAVDTAATAVSLVLKSGEVWVFRSGGRKVRLEPSVYLESNRLKPRATQQIVLSGSAMGYATRVRWSLSKPQDTAIGVRDLVQDPLPIPQD